MLTHPKLETGETGKRFVQFELWKECSAGCKFCFNKGLPDCDKLWSIQDCIDRIQHDPVVALYNEIGFIGGEFFSGHELSDAAVENAFYQLMDTVTDNPHRWQKLYITTSFLYSDLTDLRVFLRYLKTKGFLERLLLCTSYDTIYRFHNENGLRLWERNVDTVHKEFPEVKIHIETIVTQDFCERVLDGRFSIPEFQKRFNVSVDYLEPNTGSFSGTKEAFDKVLPNFLLKRQTFLRFLHKVFVESPCVDPINFFNRGIRADCVFNTYGNRRVEILGRHHNGKLGDASYYAVTGIKPAFGYVDSDTNIRDDTRAFLEQTVL